MTDNLRLGPDAEANHRIRLLRAEAPAGDIENGTPLVPGVWLAWPGEGAVAGSLRAGADLALDLDVTAVDGCDWYTLNVSLGGFDLKDSAVLGVVAKGSAARTLALKACVRSGTEDGFVDCFFDKHLILTGEEAVHLDIFETRATAQLPAEAPWRDFVLFLPTDRSFALTLSDLRFFVV